MKMEVYSPERNELEYRAEYNEILSRRHKIAATVLGLTVGAFLLGAVAMIAALLGGY